MPKVSWTGDASSAERAAAAVATAQKKMNAEFATGAKGAKNLEEAAKRIKEAVDPQERYNRKLAEAVAHQKAGRLTTEQLAAATKKYKADLDAAGQAGNSTFGAALKGKIGDIAFGIGGATAAIGLFKSAFQAAEAQAQQSADRIMQSLGSFLELGQLDAAGGAQAIKTSRELVRVGAVSPDNQAQAVGIASNMVNAGINAADTKFVINDLAATGLISAENLDTVAGNIQKLKTQFGGSFSDVTGKLKEASNLSQANLSVTSREILKYAPLASRTGVSLEEAAASFVIAEQGSASPEAAAENLKSFYSQVYRRDLAKGDLQGTLANIQTKIGKGNAFDQLGDANAVIGFELLSKRMKDLTKIEGDLSGAKFSIGSAIDDDPRLRAGRTARKAAGNRAMTIEELYAEKEEIYDALRDERYARRAKRDGTFIATIAEWGQAGEDWGQDEAGAFRRALDTEKSVPGSHSQDLLRDMRDYLQRIDQSNRGIEGRQRAKATTRSE